MTDYDNNLRGALFKNDKKREGKQDPDYNGSCEVDGQEYWLNAWLKKSKSGVTFMSLSLKPKEARPKVAPESKPETPAFNDDIPF